ncbi:thioesterase [Micromonospora sp. NPDC005203]|uniref:thioesterase n=1 Tax=Micromonospora sp. NPDC005203 TaxID=3364226 RepID=UPI0036961879
MTTTLPATADLLSVSETLVRPRYEGSNICSWIGFKHVNYLVEEAVLDYFRQSGLPSRKLYEQHALGLDLVVLNTRIAHAFHLDDLARATVTFKDVSGGEMVLAVTIEVDRESGPVRAVTSTVRVQLRVAAGSGPAGPPPSAISDLVTDHITRDAGPVDARRALPLTVAELAAEGNAVVWRSRIPYFYCHFTERLQMSGYLRLMEEAVDVFLAERGASIKTLLDEQNWIPVVPHSNVTILDEALMEETIYTLFTVEQVFKRATYTARLDWFVERDGRLVRTATGQITHGYAVILDRSDWTLVDFDDRLYHAVSRPSGRRVLSGDDLA